jgi:uncharacterized protein (DUF302 family)
MTVKTKLSSIFLAFAITTPVVAATSDDTSSATAMDPRAIVVEREVQRDFKVTVDTLRHQLVEDGWNLVAEIDLGRRLAKKGVEVPGGLVIFKLTSGKNAMPLLAEDDTRYVSAMMPCGVSVYGRSDGGVVISRMNFEMLGTMMEPAVAAVMKKSIAKLNSSVDATLSRLAEN